MLRPWWLLFQQLQHRNVGVGRYSFTLTDPLSLDLYLIILRVNKLVSSTTFTVFGMTRPRFEPRSPASLLLTRHIHIHISSHISPSNRDEQRDPILVHDKKVLRQLQLPSTIRFPYFCLLLNFITKKGVLFRTYDAWPN